MTHRHNLWKIINENRIDDCRFSDCLWDGFGDGLSGSSEKRDSLPLRKILQ